MHDGTHDDEIESRGSKRWKDPAYKHTCINYQKRRYGECDEFRQERIAHSRAYRAKVSADPNYRAKRAQAMRRYRALQKEMRSMAKQ